MPKRSNSITFPINKPKPKPKTKQKHKTMSPSTNDLTTFPPLLPEPRGPSRPTDTQTYGTLPTSTPIPHPDGAPSPQNPIKAFIEYLIDRILAFPPLRYIIAVFRGYWIPEGSLAELEGDAAASSSIGGDEDVGAMPAREVVNRPDADSGSETSSVSALSPISEEQESVDGQRHINDETPPLTKQLQEGNSHTDPAPAIVSTTSSAHDKEEDIKSEETLLNEEKDVRRNLKLAKIEEQLEVSEKGILEMRDLIWRLKGLRRVELD